MPQPGSRVRHDGDIIAPVQAGTSYLTAPHRRHSFHGPAWHNWQCKSRTTSRRRVAAFFDPERRTAAAEEARAKAEQHSMEHSVRETLAVYEQVLHQKRMQNK